MSNNSQDAKWYIIQTFSSYENTVMQSLNNLVQNNDEMKDYIFDIQVPTEDDIVEKNGKKKVIQRKKFPSYVFIKMIYTKQVWYLVTQTRGVTSFVGPGGRPLPLTDEEVKRNKLEAMDIEDIKLSVGDQVKITTGALEGFIGTVDNIDIPNQKIKVIVSMFGRDTSAELEFVEVEKLDVE